MLKLITQNMLDTLMGEAQQKQRKRSHYNIHESFADPVQKFFVSATPESYFCPHRHTDKTEFAIIIQGQFEVLLFDDDGTITTRQPVGNGTGIVAFEIPVNTWHTWLVKSENAVFFEAKPGPYDPVTAAEFAPWAPPESSLAAGNYLRMLLEIE